MKNFSDHIAASVIEAMSPSVAHNSPFSSGDDDSHDNYANYGRDCFVPVLRKLSKSDVLAFIRYRLSVNGNRRRFDMSGYEDFTGSVTKHNQAILDLFADLGIYDYQFGLVLDFYKGGGRLTGLDFHGDPIFKEDMSGETTAEIILAVFKHTIFSGRSARRRS